MQEGRRHVRATPTHAKRTGQQHWTHLKSRHSLPDLAYYAGSFRPEFARRFRGMFAAAIESLPCHQLREVDAARLDVYQNLAGARFLSLLFHDFDFVVAAKSIQYQCPRLLGCLLDCLIGAILGDSLRFRHRVRDKLQKRRLNARTTTTRRPTLAHTHPAKLSTVSSQSTVWRCGATIFNSNCTRWQHHMCNFRGKSNRSSSIVSTVGRRERWWVRV